MKRYLAALLVTLALAGCADNDDDDDATPATTTSTAAGVTTSTTSADGGDGEDGGDDGPATTVAPGSTTPVSTPPTEYRYLTAVRVAGHDGFDRVVFEFRSGVPGYSVKYVNRPIREDGSGNVVNVQGDAVLEVRMEAASGADTSEGFRPTYQGPTRVRGDTEAVTEVVRTGDFEAVLTWVIGVRSQRPFRVTPVGGNRLAIDITT